MNKVTIAITFILILILAATAELTTRYKWTAEHRETNKVMINPLYLQLQNESIYLNWTNNRLYLGPQSICTAENGLCTAAGANITNIYNYTYINFTQNATLYSMFPNITNVMNNQTIFNMINAVSDNDTDTDTDTTYTAGDGLVLIGTEFRATAVNGSGEAPAAYYMTFDIRNSKYKGVIWDITDAEAESVTIIASTTEELIFGRYIE